jgi:hypothetical protein
LSVSSLELTNAPSDIPPGKSMRLVVFFPAVTGVSVSMILILVFADLVAGFFTPTVWLRALLAGGARIGAERLGCAARPLRRGPPGDGGIMVRGRASRGTAGIPGHTGTCWSASCDGGGVEERLNLIVSAQVTSGNIRNKVDSLHDRLCWSTLCDEAGDVLKNVQKLRA